MQHAATYSAMLCLVQWLRLRAWKDKGYLL